jgi:hypothetical protein
MSEIDARYVKRGFWINIEQGSIMGRTITTDIRTGTVIIALLSVLAALAISHLWQIFLFTCHQLRARGGPADGLFRQQQVLLRATPPPSSFFADWVKLWWLWRGHTKRAFSRSILQLLLSLVFASGTIAVGIFSSYVVSSTNLQVLVDSSNCAPLDLYNLSSEDYQKYLGNLAPYNTNLEVRSKAFAEECYENSSSSSARCNAFVRTGFQLPYERVECPFDKKICMEQPLSAVRVDSGLVNADEVMGWNLGIQDRVRYRRRATCGLLRHEGYSSVIDATSYPNPTRPSLPGEKLLLSHYCTYKQTFDWANATFALSLITFNVTPSYICLYDSPCLLLKRPPFKIRTDFSSSTHIHLDPEWGQIAVVKPELNYTEADLSIISIAKNAVNYREPVDDPVFAAHQPFQYDNNPYDYRPSQNIYRSDWPNAALGCQQQVLRQESTLFHVWLTVT